MYIPNNRKKKWELTGDVDLSFNKLPELRKIQVDCDILISQVCNCQVILNWRQDILKLDQVMLKSTHVILKSGQIMSKLAEKSTKVVLEQPRVTSDQPRGHQVFDCPGVLSATCSTFLNRRPCTFYSGLFLFQKLKVQTVFLF